MRFTLIWSRFLVLGAVASLSAEVLGGFPRSLDSASSPQVSRIDEQIRRAWSDSELLPSSPATEGAWLRRIYLDLLGRIPAIDELTLYLEDSSRDKRRKIVDRLLGEEYAEEYARNFTTIWANLLVGHTGGTARDSLVSRAGMQQYLREAFLENKPFDQMMRELVTASGSARPGDDDFNGAVNFLADKMGDKGVQATAKTAQIFLGLAVQCTQCHNHPFNENKQNQFWEFNAFFRQARLVRLEEGENRRVARILDRDFAGEGGDPTKAELYYELRNGKLKVAYPVFVDGTALVDLYADQGEDFGDSGYLSDIDRREELVKFIRASPEFPRAIVNRVWRHFLGYGFTKPVDDMGPHNPPSHPELLNFLAEEFRGNDFDLKRLMRWIVLSEPYSLSSRGKRVNEKDDPTLGTAPRYSRFYLRQMQAEQLYESLLVATKADEGLPYDQRESVKQRWLDQFNTAFGDDENGEATTFNGSIPQVLTLMNGDLVKQATSARQGSFLGRIAADESLSSPRKIRRLYLAALARRPSRQELALSDQILAARHGNVAAALEDVWWAILNSNEFILNH